MFFILSLNNARLKVKTSLLALGLGLLAIAASVFIQLYTVRIPFFPENALFALLSVSLISKSLVVHLIKAGLIFPIPSKNKSFPIYFCCLILFGTACGSFEFSKWIINGDLFLAITWLLIHIFSSALTGIFIWFIKEKQFRILPLIYSITAYGLFAFFASFTSLFKYISLAAVLFTAIETRIWFKYAKEAENF